MLKVLTINGCRPCEEFIKLLEHNNIEYEEEKEPLDLHKYLKFSNLPILIENEKILDRGEFLLNISR